MIRHCQAHLVVIDAGRRDAPRFSACTGGAPNPRPKSQVWAADRSRPDGLRRIIAATKKRWRLKRAQAATAAAKKAAPAKAAKKAAVKKTAPAPAALVDSAGR